VDGFNVPARVSKFLGWTRKAYEFCFTCVCTRFLLTYS
jgi:hypothetical protein